MVSPNPAWRGDPTFLPEVLRHWGLTVHEFPGWRDRGHGDFGAIQGIMVHHIGSNSYPPAGIARHPSLGLCSQLHLARNGDVTICGVGIAWHAGRGWFAGWPTNDANRVSIGVEPEGDGLSAWPKQQMDAYYRLCAAILWFLGKRATTQTLLGHWEYSKAAQGKWDPGAGTGRFGESMNMNEFRARVNWYIDNPPFNKNTGSAGKEDAVAFDEISRRYKSRVDGSTVTMRPIDALLNIDAHSFVSRANTEKMLGILDSFAQELKGLREEVAELRKGAK